MAEIVMDERGNEQIVAKCHDRAGTRTVDPRNVFMNVVSGKFFVRVDGRVAKPGFREEADAINHWLDQRGLPSPSVECGGE